MGMRVLLGSIPATAEVILKNYLNEYGGSDVEFVNVQGAGAKSRVKTVGSKADTLLVVLDDYTWGQCSTACASLLADKKCFRYTDDTAFKRWLTGWFGPLHDDHSEQLSFSQGVVNNGQSSSDSDSGSSQADLAKIKDLERQLANQKAMVSNLTAQLNDAKEGADVSEFISRIRELESEVEQKKAELALNKSNTTGSIQELNNLRSRCEQLEKDKRGIESNNDELVSRIDRLNDDLATYRRKYDEAVSQAESLQSTVATLQASSVNSEELVEKQQALADAEKTIQQLRSEIESKDEQVRNLGLELKSKQDRIDEYKQDMQSMSEELEVKEKLIADGRKASQQIQFEYNEAKEKLQKTESELEELRGKITSLNGLIAEKTAKITELSEANVRSTEQLKLMQEDSILGESKDAEIHDLYEEIAGYKAKLNTVKDDLAAKEAELSAIKLVQEKSGEALQSANDSVDKLEQEKAELEASLADSRTEVENLLEKVDKLTAEKEEKSKQVSDLSLQVGQLEGKNKALQEVADAAKQAQEASGVVEVELSEAKRRAAQLEIELNTLKSYGFGSKQSSNDIELEQLRERVKELESKDNEADLEDLKTQLEEANEELEMANDALNDFRNSPVSGLYTLTNPRSAYSYELKVPSRESLNKSKFYVFAAGSNESKSALYAAMMQSFGNSKKRILVLDLVTDTDIDRSFGVKSAQYAIPWLMGSQKLSGKLTSETRFKNVRVITTALAYFNDFCLLAVDWESRLSELNGAVDIVIVNVGSLSNSIAKILYKSFIKAMPAKIVLKATPVNIRSCVMNIAGLNLPSRDVEVYCYDFDEKLAGQVFKALAEKANAFVKKPNEIISVG